MRFWAGRWILLLHEEGRGSGERKNLSLPPPLLIGARGVICESPEGGRWKAEEREREGGGQKG